MRCSKFKQQTVITSKQYEIGCQLLLITNRKSQTVFWLVPTSVTSNDLERRNAFSYSSPATWNLIPTSTKQFQAPPQVSPYSPAH